MLYTIAFNIHIYISTITLLSGIMTIVLSILGLTKKRDYSRIDGWTAVVFSIGLNFQLILGFIIYFTLRTNLEGAMWHVADTENDASLRFWAIEHIALMIFALFLTQMGRVFIKRTTQHIRKFRASMFYYGTALLLILFSVSIALFFR